ncbi:MBL fold metallo-hydrolase [Nocardioides sp.]|uniref:MBL fold metallo-hydrolase n=1 Tax=Nocardioides sp. TaxID=35761 RepID=UPI000C8C1838|nr:MBL fold metallo-hydrolase [Nocardioides sp.]MAS54023.1 MBL fold metallo-hydrolase [Pimelobacter sp.]MDE0777403.1 MBL fold metallo-hydrolase [Nocardioides sp.]
MSFSEVADRVWVARYEWFDANVTLVRGDRGLLVVDTHASAVAARQVIDDVRALGIGEVVEIVNTHEHFDHTFGNGEFRAAYGPDVPIHAHEEAAARTASAAERIKAVYADNPDEPRGDEVLATTVVPAETTFSSAVALDLGDRFVELVHPGRGHTCGDLVVRVPDADVLLAGDLVEESGPREHTPGFGADCFPMEWPLTLDIVLGLTSSSSVVVPGHGALVDRDFVEEQRNDIGILAETIRDLAGRGVPVDEALSTADAWPFPVAYLGEAVRRAYEHLPRSQKRLPLI